MSDWAIEQFVEASLRAGESVPAWIAGFSTATAGEPQHRILARRHFAALLYIEEIAEGLLNSHLLSVDLDWTSYVFCKSLNEKAGNLLGRAARCETPSQLRTLDADVMASIKDSADLLLSGLCRLQGALKDGFDALEEDEKQWRKRRHKDLIEAEFLLGALLTEQEVTARQVYEYIGAFIEDAGDLTEDKAALESEVERWKSYAAKLRSESKQRRTQGKSRA